MGDLKENINLHHKQFIVFHLPSRVKSSFLLFLISSNIKKNHWEDCCICQLYPIIKNHDNYK